MKLAKKYDDWVGPLSLYDFEKNTLSDESIVWFSELCTSNLQEPTSCNHKPIYYSEFKKMPQKPTSNIFYKRKNQTYLVQKLVLWTTVLGLITALIAFGKGLFNKDETTKIVICNNLYSNCDYEDITGEANGKKATFRVAYLTQEKRWQYGSETTLNDGTMLCDNIKEKLPHFPNFEKAIGLIAVGTASQEGENQEIEELRADRRADAILFNIRDNSIAVNKELYKLNLGQFKEKRNLDKQETAYQRRVIIIGILEKDSTMSITETKTALRNALIDSEGLKYDTDKYSKFDFTLQN
jgi:hypothetical protein